MSGAVDELAGGGARAGASGEGGATVSPLAAHRRRGAAASGRALRPGTVVLVGGGPGDPDLLTVGGLRAVQQADVIAYDRLAPLAVLADAKPGALLIDVGKEPHGRQTSQERINELLIAHARAGRRVVRLKGGDGYVFGRGGEEALACAAAGVPVRVVPGVTSSIAGPALAGIPVTHRSLTQGFTVVSGHVAPGDPRSTLDWAALARGGTTLVVLMGVTHLRLITDALIAGGLGGDVPAAVVESACDPGMRVLRGPLHAIAASAAAAGLQPPAITIVGEVAALDLAPALAADLGQQANLA